LAILVTMVVTYLFLVDAKKIQDRVGPKGIDAVTRIVGFFVATIGMGLIFNGIIEALQAYGVITGR
jgi:multiple antibiotic resistance protein